MTNAPIERHGSATRSEWLAPQLRRLAACEAETGAAPDIDGFETFS